jgi:GTP-binding protein Era
MIQKIQQTNAPIIILINKIDLSDQQGVKEEILFWENRLPGSDVIPISALESFNIDKVFDLLLEKLPESPPYYDKSEFTTRSMRFFVSEIIRGKILLNYRKEIPYSVEVAVDSYKEETQLIRISATIFVDRESQKAIILGHQGKSIKKTATEARKDIEEFVESKVFLEITVKVKKDWRNNEDMLKRFGYDQ